MQEFRRGQIIYFDDPFAAVLAPEKVDLYCSCCFGKLPRSALVLPCLQCGKLVYCGSQCQLQDATYHGIECEVLQSYEFTPSEVLRLTIRVLARGLTERATDLLTVNHFFEHTRTINDLITHYEDCNEETLERIRRSASDLKEKLDAVQFVVPIDTIVEMMMKISINSNTVFDSGAPTNLKIGTALYLGASKMNHTCEPIENYVQSFNGPNLILTAVKNFSIEDSLELKTHYVPPIWTVRRRRAKLSSKYYFVCNCTRCLLDLATDEPNLPTNLEAFAELAPGEAWSHIARDYFNQISRFPPTNYYHYILTYKLQLSCSRRQDLHGAVRFGSLALLGCMSFEDRKQILYMLCHDMAKLGYHLPTSPGFEQFVRVRSEAVQLLSLVFEPRHSLVLSIRRLRPRKRRHQ